jgi:DNA-directed RNA polymerase subunit RPC12/RpoP
MGKFGNKRIPKFMSGEPIPESHTGVAIHPEILSLKGHGDDHAMIIIKTHDGQEVELRFDYDGDGMLTAQHGDHEYSIPVEVEIVSDMDESAHIDEISNTVKRSAFLKSWNKSKELDPENDGFKKIKASQQAHAFQTHISPDIKREADSVASMFGNGVSVEIKKGGGGSSDDYQQFVSLEFFEGREIFAKITIYSDGRVDKVGQFPENIQRRLIRFIDKVRHEELSKPTKGYELAEAKKGKPDFLDVDKDGDKKESMKKALQDKKKGKAAKTFESFVNECWNPMEEGYSPAMSEEAREAIKKICEDLLIKEAQACDEDRDPSHTYENYLNECGSYMTECMMEAAASLKVDESDEDDIASKYHPSRKLRGLDRDAKKSARADFLKDPEFYNPTPRGTYSCMDCGAKYDGALSNSGVCKKCNTGKPFRVTLDPDSQPGEMVRKRPFRDYEDDATLGIYESTAYKCDTCGERAEHEEIEENPKMRCSNCGDRSWIPEH